MLRFTCDQCGKPHAVAAEHAGKKTICVKCGARIPIPGASPTPVTATAPVAAPATSTATRKPVAAPVAPAPAKRPAAPREAPTAGLDIYGLEEALADAPSHSPSAPAGASASGAPSDEDSLPPPKRLDYAPLSEAKKKKIAKRAAKADRLKPSNATVGVSFGAVLAFALIGWRIYRVVHRIERAARADDAQVATMEDFDPKRILAAMDEEAEQRIAEKSTAEARDWLDTARYPNHQVMKMSLDTAREMVAGFYQRGAEKVYVLEPETLGSSVMTAEFGVTLPTDAAKRKQCLEWAAKYEESDGPTPDQGQRYLLVATD
ncbi:MAG: hypothetical protein ACYC61_15740 [Isosphaeraceae bacterium]